MQGIEFSVIFVYKLIFTDMNTTSYITGRKCEKFKNLEDAKKYADKWNDKSISAYVNGTYSQTIHKKDGKW